MILIEELAEEGEVLKIIEEAEESANGKNYNWARKLYSRAHKKCQLKGCNKYISRIKDGVFRIADEHFLNLK